MSTVATLLLPPEPAELILSLETGVAWHYIQPGKPQQNGLRSLMGLAETLQLAPRPLRVELEALGKIELPAILHWDLNHYVVLASVGRRTLTVHDPAAGKRTLTFAEASKHFTGVVLALTPATNFTPVTARAPMPLRRLWSRLQGGRAAFAQVLVLSLALQLATFAGPFQLQLVVDEAIFRADADLLVVLALAFGGLVIVQAALEGLRGWVLRVYGQMLTFQVVGNVVHHLLRLPADFFEKRHLGDILSRLGSVQPIQDALTRGLIAALIDGLMALIAAAILFVYSPTLALVVIAAIFIQLAVALAYYPAIRARMEAEIVARAKESSVLMETVRAATTIKLMGREIEREATWRNAYASVTNTGLRTGKLQITQGALQSVVTGLQTVLVIFLAARMILAGDGFSVGMLFAFLSFRQTLTDRALALISQALQFRLLRLHLDRLADIVTAAPEASGPALPALDVAGAITVTGLSFRYGAADPLVLEDVCIDVAPGDFIAITGASGSGKTTLLKLLLGLYPPTAGSILLDGQQASPELWRAWRQHVGVVAQDDRLMSGTLADNIAFFDPDLDMARVEATARLAQVHDDIQRLPMRYLSLVGDMGSTLSGGQRQRVLLARALYRNPQILILDEGTANLDEATEEILADLITGLKITRIVVAHRPALVRRANKVFVLQDRHLQAFVAPAPEPVSATHAAAPSRGAMRSL